MPIHIPAEEMTADATVQPHLLFPALRPAKGSCNTGSSHRITATAAKESKKDASCKYSGC